MTRRCEWCGEPITLLDAQTTSGNSAWHTSCWNQAAEQRAAYIAECDESEGFTSRPLPDELPMSETGVSWSEVMEKFRADLREGCADPLERWRILPAEYRALQPQSDASYRRTRPVGHRQRRPSGRSFVGLCFLCPSGRGRLLRDFRSLLRAEVPIPGPHTFLSTFAPFLESQSPCSELSQGHRGRVLLLHIAGCIFHGAHIVARLSLHAPKLFWRTGAFCLTFLPLQEHNIYMERLTEQTAADLAGNYARNRFRDEIANSTAHPDGYVCQNCGGVTDRLTQVPEFEYMGCDDCMEEALKQIERQQARKLVWGEGVHSGRLPEVA